MLSDLVMFIALQATLLKTCLFDLHPLPLVSSLFFLTWCRDEHHYFSCWDNTPTLHPSSLSVSVSHLNAGDSEDTHPVLSSVWPSISNSHCLWGKGVLCYCILNISIAKIKHILEILWIFMVSQVQVIHNLNSVLIIN